MFKLFAVLMRMVAPEFITPPTDIIIMEEESGQSSCVVKGKPAPKITWYRNKKSVANDDHMTVEDVVSEDGTVCESVLKYVDAVPEKYDGKYVVEAKNEAGKATYDVTVLGK